jgi:ABC-type transport system involved in multi-copper enzyme maturation permease subunit
MSSVNACRDWVRRNVGWSNSRDSWQERIGLGLVLAGAAAVAFLSRGLSLSYQLLLWGLLLAALAGVMRRGWLKLFGPVLFYDLVRTARRSRYFLIRSLYLTGVLMLLCWVWMVWKLGLDGRPPSREQLAAFAASFFWMFMAVQFLVAVVLTPAYAAGSIADEKDRKTLEFLLATDLRNREIVLSKLVSRLANIMLLVLAGLPVLGFLQFLGGIDPTLLLAGFAATAVTVLSLACLGILFSTLSRKAYVAIVVTYLAATAYLLVSALSLPLADPSLGLYDFPSTASWTSPVEVQDLVASFTAGNIFVILFRDLLPGLWGGAPLDALVPPALRNYAIFHGLLALGCTVWAVLGLRRIALREASEKPKQDSLVVRLLGRPRVSNQPMIWKEVFAESGLQVRGVLRWLVRLLVAALVIVSFLPVVFIVANFIDDLGSPRYGRSFSDPWSELRLAMNIWVRSVGTIVACLLLMVVAVRAATSIGTERDRQTWSSLLTSPLDSNDILLGKWLGSLLCIRWGWLWLGAIWFLAVVTGGMNVLALPLLVIAWFVFAAFLATLGMWFATVSPGTLQATLWTLLATVGLAFGHWMIWMCCGPVMALTFMNSGPDRVLMELVEWAWKFEAFALTPPVTIGFLAFHGREFEHGSSEMLECLACAVVGLMGWLAAAVGLGALTSARLRQVTGRTAWRRPDWVEAEPYDGGGA